ncbi:hypothetical protein VNO78_16291 [Psophocarpus tetragonolobus]|uniref:Uncharacterized protein n=1 Tax=Psophocarpus tetragonolobus TaxID=3891 RepID=A0AAN9SFK7_PSOTE
MQGMPDEKALQSIPNTWLAENKAIDESGQDERQPEAEFTEEQGPKHDTQQIMGIITANDTKEQEQDPKEKLGAEDNGKFNQEEAKGIEGKKYQLTDEELQTTLQTSACVGHTDLISQQVTLQHKDELEGIMSEIELHGKSNVEEPEPIEEKSKAEFIEKINKVESPKYNMEETAQIIITNDTEEQKEVLESDPKEKLVIAVSGKFNQEETKAQLPDEEVPTTLSTPASVLGHIDQISQQQTLHNHESEGIDNAKSYITDIELHGKFTVVEEPETKQNDNMEREEQTYLQSEESSMPTFTANMVTAEGYLASERSTKLSDDAKLDQQEIVESYSVENLEKKNEGDITSQDATDATQSAEVEISKSETEGEPESKALQSILNTRPVKNETLADSSEEQRQPEAEFKEKINKEVQSPTDDMEETAEIITTNDTKEQKEVLASNPKEKQGIEVDEKFNLEESHGNEEETKAQLPDEEVQTTLSTPASTLSHTDRISQKQTQHKDESESIDNAKSCIAEIELHGKSSVVEKPENKQNDTIEREEQTYLQSEEPSIPTFTTNIVTAEGHLASESSTKLSDDPEVDQQESIESYSVKYLDNKTESDVNSEEAREAIQLGDVEISMSKTEGVPEDKALESILNTRSAKNETLAERSEEERQPEAEFIEKINKVQSPTYDMEETEEIITANDTEEQKEVQASDLKEKLGIEVYGKFNQEEAERNEEETKAHLTDEEVQTTLSTPASTLGHSDRISHQESQHNDESEGIDNAKSCMPEIELHGKSTVVEEPENKQKDNIEREEQTYIQSEESRMSTFTTNIVTAEGNLASESSTNLSDDAEVNQQETVESYSVKNLENKTESDINSKEATEAIQSVDVEISKSETEGVPEDKALQLILNTRSVKKETFTKSSEERQPEAEFIEKINKEVQSPICDMEENAEIITANDTEEQKEVSAFDPKEKLGNEYGAKFNQEEAKGNGEETKAQLPDEEVQTTFSTPASILGPTDQISQQQTLHNDELEMIDNAKSCIPDIEHHGKFTDVEEPEKQNENIEKEKQTYLQSEESSMPTFTANIVTAEEHPASESSIKLSDDTEVNQQQSVESYLVVNLEKKNESDITSEEATDAIQLADVEISKSETEGVPEDKTLQSILNTRSVKNETLADSSEGERQPEPEFIEKINKEVQTAKYDLEEIAEIITPNDTEERKEVPASDPKENLGIEVYGKFNQEEAKGNEEQTKAQLPDEEVQTTLSTPASLLGHTDKISQQQTLYSDESERIDNAKNYIPEIELHGKSTVAEEPEEPETKEIHSIKKEEQAYLQSEESSEPTLTTSYVTAEGHLASESSTKLSDNIKVDGQETVGSYLVENLEKNESDITSVEATNAIKSADMEMSKSKTKGLIEDEIWEILSTPEIVQVDTEQIIQQTLYKDESEATDDVQSCIAKTELDRMITVVEEPDQPKTKVNVVIVEEEQADNQSQGSSIQSVITNCIVPEGRRASESSTKISYDMNEQKTVEDLEIKDASKITEEDLEIKDASKITAEEVTNDKELSNVEIEKSETEGVPEDNVLQTLANAALVRNETVDESHKKEIQSVEEFEETYTKVQTPQYEFNAKEDILEKETCQLTAKDEQKSESQSVLHNEETKDMKHPYSDGETAEINHTHDTEEQEDFSVSPTKEKLVVEDDEKFNQEEAKRIDEATKTQLLNTARESLKEEEVQPKFATPATVQGDLDQILHKQTLHNDESEAIDNSRSCIPENEPERMSIVFEDLNQPEMMANFSIVKEEQRDHQSEPSSRQSANSNYINAVLQISESSAKLCDDVDQQKTVDSHSDSVNNLESKDASVPVDKAMQTLPSTISAGIEEVDKSIQEIHTEAKLALTDTGEGPISEKESEAKKEVSEYVLENTFDLYKATSQTIVENGQKAELLSEQQSQETTVTDHLNLEGETIKINPTNEIEEHEKVKASHNRETLETDNDGNFIQEEEKEMEKATERQLLKTATESVPKDQVQSTVVKGETVEGIVQEQTIEEKESAAIDNNTGRPENELEQMVNVVEAIDQHETMAKISVVNEEHASHHCEQSNMETVISKHVNSEGMVTVENNTKSSYNVEELKKVLDSNTIENSEIKNGRKIMLEEASNMKEATGMELKRPEIENVHEDEAISTVPTIPSSVKVEIVDKSIQKATHKEVEPEVTNTIEEQRAENDFAKNMEVLKASELHKAPGNTSLEDIKKAEVQSEAKRQDIMITKHPYLESQETEEISPSNYTKELEKEHQVTKPRGVSESVYADITEQTETEKPETQEVETTQLDNTKEDEFEKISPSSSFSVISRDSQDTDTKVSQKKSHGILSGVGSKVKHSISKVKKAITGKSSHPKTSPSSK